MLHLKLEASERLLGILGLGSKLCPGNIQRMLNKDLTRFMRSLSREHQNRASKRKALLAGGPMRNAKRRLAENTRHRLGSFSIHDSVMTHKALCSTHVYTYII